jgi:hypothetical protein
VRIFFPLVIFYLIAFIHYMRTGLAHFSSLIAILMLLASGTLGVQARTMAPAVDQVVLCTGTGLVIIAVDANGRPTSTPQHCPECYGMISCLVLPSSNPSHSIRHFFSDAGAANIIRHIGRIALVHPARGPPQG